jgi:hypothetical protein
MFGFHMPAVSCVSEYIFMATCNFLPPFYEAKFCGVLSRVFVKLCCATVEKRLRNTGLVRGHRNIRSFCCGNDMYHLLQQSGTFHSVFTCFV